MKATNSTKSFDAVEMMRDIRSKVTQETENMSFLELQQFIKRRLAAAKQHPTPVAR